MDYIVRDMMLYIPSIANILIIGSRNWKSMILSMRFGQDIMEMTLWNNSWHMVDMQLIIY